MKHIEVSVNCPYEKFDRWYSKNALRLEAPDWLMSMARIGDTVGYDSNGRWTLNGVEVEEHSIPAPVLRPRWKAWLARLFGQRIEEHDEEFTMVSYKWRGTLWVWSWWSRR